MSFSGTLQENTRQLQCGLEPWASGKAREVGDGAERESSSVTNTHLPPLSC